MFLRQRYKMKRNTGSRRLPGKKKGEAHSRLCRAEGGRGKKKNRKFHPLSPLRHRVRGKEKKKKKNHGKKKKGKGIFTTIAPSAGDRKGREKKKHREIRFPPRGGAEGKRELGGEIAIPLSFGDGRGEGKGKRHQLCRP